MIFNQFVSNWLYSNDGYYSKYQEIGKNGDFYTSVSSSIFFGGSIANEIINIFKKSKLENLNICEIGAHRGYLIADVIQFIYTLDKELLDHFTFTIVERFEHLQNIQEEYLKSSFGDIIHINFIKNINENSSSNIFYISNEIFDSFPFDIFNGSSFATVDDKFNINFNTSVESNYIKKYNVSVGEVPFGYESFLKDIYDSGENIYFLTFDYGEKFHRSDYSTRIYKNHKTYPIFEPNLNIRDFYMISDITFDVNFQYIMDIASMLNFSNIKFNYQSTTLVDFGIIDLLDIYKKNSDEKSYIYELNKAMRLLSPDFLGDRFKSLSFSKGFYDCYN